MGRGLLLAGLGLCGTLGVGAIPHEPPGWALAPAVGGSVGGPAFPTRTPQGTLTPGPGGTPSPASPLLGVNIDLTRYPPEQREAYLKLLASAGVFHLRQPLRWAEMETRPGLVDFRESDALVAAAERHQMRLLFSLHTSPAWARHDPPPPRHWWLCDEPGAVAPELAHFAPPTDPNDLARFAGALASRYRGRLWAIEVWREPNLLPNWRRSGPDPEDYGRLLDITARAVRQAAPEILVVSAGLAPTTDVGVCYLSDYVFLDRLAASGALARVDAVGIEPFGLRLPPSDLRRDREVLNFARAELLAGVLAKRKLTLPIWALAWGWRVEQPPAPQPDEEPSTSQQEIPRAASWRTERESPIPAASNNGSPWGGHPAAEVARWLPQAWAYARAHWPWMGPMFLWQFQPGPLEPADQWGYALVASDGKPTVLWPSLTIITSGQASLAAWPPSSEGWLGQRKREAAIAAGFLLLLLAAVALAVRPELAESLRRCLSSVVRRLEARDTAQLVILWLVGLAATALPWWPASLFGLPLLVLLAVARPPWAVATVAAALPFYFRLRLHAGPRWFGSVELLLAVAVAGWLGARWLASSFAVPRRREQASLHAAPRSGRQPAADRRAWAAVWSGAHSAWQKLRRAANWHLADGLALLLVVWAALSLCWTTYRPVAWREWRTVILEPVLFYGLLRLDADRRRYVQAALDGAVLGGLLAALWALFNLGLAMRGLTDGVVVAEGVFRLRGPYGSPNNLALYLGRLLPLLILGTASPSPRRRFYGLAAPPIVFALLGTFSRGALLVGVPAVGLYLLALGRGWRVRWRRVAPLALLAAGLAAALLLPFATSQRLRGSFDLAPGSTLFFRLRLWQSSLEMLRDHWLLGVGLDNFLPLYRDIYVQRDAVQERFLSHPHNWLLDWWLRLGVVGLAIFVALTVTNLRLGWRLVRPNDRRPYCRAAGALGMQVYTLAHGLVDQSFFLVDLAMLWWLAQAAILAPMGEEDAARAVPRLARKGEVGPPGFEPGTNRL